MESYLIYIAKVALSASVFYLAFLVLFQNQKHFVFNRLYLPVSLVISFAIPLITFTTISYVEPAPIVVTENIAGTVVLPEISQEPTLLITWIHYALGIYVLGFLGFVFYLIFGHIKAIQIVRKSVVKSLFKRSVNITKKDVHPFSFFNKIVLSNLTLSHPNLEIIVEHENIHVKEKHTIDILISEILFLFQWFNPFAWLIKDAIKNNLEYLTDSEIAQKYDPQSYQLAMVSLADKKGLAPFLTALNGNQLKNRIIMMKKKTENKYNLLKQFLVLPLLAVLVMGLANKVEKTEILKVEKTVEIILDGTLLTGGHPVMGALDFSKGFDGRDVIRALNVEDKVISNTLSINKEQSKLTYFVRTSDYVIGTNPEFEENTDLLKDSGRTEKKETLFAINNKLVEKANFEKASQSGFKTLTILRDKDAKTKYGESATGVVIEATTGDSNFVVAENSEKFEGIEIRESKEDSNDIHEKNKLSIKHSENETIQSSEWKILGPLRAMMDLESNEATYTPKTEKGLQFISSGDKTKQPLYIVDGAETKSIGHLNPESIESITVLKDESSLVKYGEKGENGVILVSTNTKELNKTRIIKGNVIDANDKPIKGASVEIKDRSFGVITNKDGEYSIEVEPSDKVLIFGYLNLDKQQVTIDNKTNVDIKIDTDRNPRIDGSLLQPNFRLRNSNGDLVKPLYIIDGKEFEAEDLPGRPSGISEYKVWMLDDSVAINKYGEKGRNGVVLIETKNKKEGIASNNDVSISVNNADPVFAKVDVMPEFPGGAMALNKYIANSVKYPEIAKENGIEGKVYVTCVINKSGKVTNPEISRGVDPALDKEALRVVSSLPKWKPGEKDGKPVNVSYTVPIQFGKQKQTQNTDMPDPLVVANGQVLNTSVNDIDSETFESITVLKGEAAIDKYGEKGKNGVVEITLKEPETISDELELRKFLAKKVKYPYEAVEKGIVGKISVSLTIDSEGEIVETGKSSIENQDMGEVVVTAMSMEKKTFTEDNENEMLRKEVLRIVKLLPVLDISEYKGETVNLNVTFNLQE